MSAFIELSRSLQQTLCMLMSVVIVTATLSLGAYQAQSALQEGYSVTVTQLQ
jgi:hypothetical protein